MAAYAEGDSAQNWHLAACAEGESAQNWHLAAYAIDDSTQNRQLAESAEDAFFLNLYLRTPLPCVAGKLGSATVEG